MKKFKLFLLLFSLQIIHSQNNYAPTGSVSLDSYLKIGNQVSPSTEGEIVRMSLTPFRHTAGPWNFKSRDNTNVAFLDFDYGATGTILTMSSQKNVGIGTTEPTVKLQVSNSINSNQNEVISSLTRFATGTGGSSIVRLGYHSTSDLEVNSGYSNAGHRFGSYFDLNIVNNHAGGNHGGINFATNSSVKMAINVNGNVGIGTSNPKNKLDVKGTIHSQEVKVDMLDWSDFVFKKDYNLPTLEQVEKHIAEKGHLENIPSEEEVLKNGINLGEMNAKLLQKIEELTLYMIEIKKNNDVMKSEIERQNKEIELLRLKNKN